MRELNPSGVILTAEDLDQIALNITEMWKRYNEARMQALEVGHEARSYINAIDIDTTSASNMSWKNRTHIPKLADLSRRLKAKVWNTVLGKPDWIMYKAEDPDKQDIADKITRIFINKLERRKFRTTEGRKLVDYFIDYGNTFIETDFIEDRDGSTTTYRGAVLRSVSPLNHVFDPTADDYFHSPKITRRMIHISKLLDLPTKLPNAGFDKSAFPKIEELRANGIHSDSIEMLHKLNLSLDGYSNYSEYFKSGMVELLIYRGDIINPKTSKVDKNRVVYVVDRMFVIRNQPSTAPIGFDGMHFAGAITRTDNLWCMSPLDNLIGMQYRIDHLENLIADMGDMYALPPVKISGSDVTEPSTGLAPGAVYYVGLDSDVNLLLPPMSGFSLDTRLQEYERRMEAFAGLPPQVQGIRTEGEKTAFEVDQLQETGAELFTYIAHNLERALETAATEALTLMLQNWDEGEEIRLTNDISGITETITLSREDAGISGEFIAMGSRHWEQERKQLLEMQNFANSRAYDIAAPHVNKLKFAKFYEQRMNLANTGIIEANAGVKEDVRLQAIAEEEAANIRAESQGNAEQEQLPNTPE